MGKEVVRAFDVNQKFGDDADEKTGRPFVPSAPVGGDRMFRSSGKSRDVQ